MLLLNMMQKGAHNDLSKVDYEWVFVHGNPDDIIDGVLSRLEKDKTRMQNLADAVQDVDLQNILKTSNDAAYLDFLNRKFSKLLEKMIVNAKTI